MEIFTKAFDFIRKNKWMVLFIATAVLLVAAITVAIVIGVNANKPDPDPEYYLGDEAGIYYYELVDGEEVLTLSENKTFTLTGPQLNKTGTYTIDAEGNMVLDFVRDEDGTTTATLSGTSLRLIYNEATITFTKKVNYTVTFNVNGGSAIDNATIVNGKTVAKPADPTKAGSAFLGWYTDVSYTTKFDFEATRITADTTIVARWVEVDVGSGVYNVSFDLGYAGAPAFSAMSTINGNVYDAPIPQRDGFTFAGWYVSMYNDGQKLCYAYDEQTVFTADTTLFAVWEATSGVAIAAPQVSVTGSAISWPAVTGATSYNIVVKNAAGATIVEKSVGTTSEVVDFSNLAAGDYVVTVTAVGAGVTSEATTRYFANKVLDRVTGITVVDGVLVYAPVANATKYTLTIDCANANHNHGTFDNGTSNTFSLASCGMKQGGIKITVTASAPGYASSVAEYTYVRNLDAISAVVYNAATDSFVWNAVANAAKYIVTVTIGETTSTFEVTTNSFSVADYTGAIAVTVAPATSGFNSPAATAASCTKNAPATPDGLTVLGNIISWNAATGAASYEVKIGDQSFPVTGTSVDITTLIQLTPKASYDIQVKSVNGSESSAYSKTLTVANLTMNPNLTYANGKVFWVPVLGTNTFNVRVNGGEIVTVTDVTSAAVDFDRAGINTIEVRCVNGRNYSEWAKIDVVAYEVIYMPRTLEGERVEYVAVGDTLTLPTDYTLTGYDFDAWYTAPDKCGIKYTGTFEGNGTLVLFAGWTAKTYTIKLSNADDKVIGFVENSTATATFNSKDFYIAPLTYEDATYSFIGWFTGPNATQEQYTDENGNGIVKYTDATETTVLYPGFVQVMKATLQPDDTYAISKGASIGKVNKITIPETYNGKPVTVVLENGFVSCKKLVEVNIPNTIELVGAGAFEGCSALTAINVYEVAGNHEPAYSSYDGALIREVTGQTYLEVYPRGKTGQFTIPEGVTEIRNKAFHRAVITGITFASTVTNIPDYAFYYCENLEVVNFADGREYPIALASQSFYNCSAIEEFNVPANILGEVADIVELFKAMPALVEINVAAGGDDAVYTSIDGMLVGKDDGFLYVYPASKELSGAFTIPAGITNIYEGAFAGSAITELVVPTYVQSIGERAFAESKLTKVTFSANRNGALEIDTEAFAECAYLTSVVFEANTRGTVDAGAVTIGESAFAPSTSMTPRLATVTFGAGVNVASIGEYAFAGQTALTTVSCADNAVVTAIGAYAFEKCDKLTEIVLSGGTTSIGDYAYSECKNVAKVTFLPGSSSINFGSHVFNDCIKLSEVNLPASLTKFDGSTFSGCNALKKVTVAAGNANYKNDTAGILYNAAETELIFYPKALIDNQNGVVSIKEGVTTISASAFSNAQGLKEITLPASITTIGDSAFAGCPYLEKVTFTAGTAALTIGESAFENCVALTDANFTIPATTTSIGAKAFYGCNFVVRNIPTGVTSIGAGAFAANRLLTTVDIPATVTTIGNGAFANCYELATVNLPASATIAIGDTLAAEENGVFYNCSNLTSIAIPAGTTAIGAYAFVNTGITSVTIPNSVTVIGDGAFQAKSSALIETITFEPGNTAPLTIGAYAFAGQSLVQTVELPYRTATIGGTDTFNDVQYSTAYSVFSGMSALKTISFQPEVAGVTAAYTANGGVLYADGGKTLLYCPVSNAGVDGELVIPKEVTLVANGALVDLNAITTVTFKNYESTDTEHYGKPLLNLGKLDIVVPGGEEKEVEMLPTELRVIGGAYTNTITKINLPSHLGRLNSGALAATAADVDVIFHENSTVALAGIAFAGSHAKEIVIPKVSEIKALAFASILSATRVVIEEVTESMRAPAYMIWFNSNLSNSSAGRTFNNSGDVLYAASNSSAFQSGKLEYIYLPDGITELADYVFLNAYNVSEVEFGDASKITAFGYSFFSQNNALVSFPFDEFTGLVSMKNSTFSGCKALVEADLSACVKLESMGNQIFSGCKALEEFVLPPNIKSLGYSIVQDTNIASISFPASFTAEMLQAPFFSMNKAVETITVDSTNPYLCADEFGVIYDKEMTIIYYVPAKIDLTEYEIPSTVKTIGRYAFRYVDFAEFDVPAAGEEMGKYVIPEGVEVIDDLAFTEMAYSRVEGPGFNLILPSTLKKIGKQAFDGATKEATVNGVQQYAGIINVIITNTTENPSQLTEIGEEAFDGCSLRTINIPDSVISIGSHAFYSSKLTEITLPAAITEIGDYMFYQVTTLTEITIQGNVETIGNYAFYSCSSLPEIDIPASVTTIGNHAFNGTNVIETVNFGEGSWLTSMGDSVFYNSGIKSIELPDSLKTIGTRAFYVQNISGRARLTSIDLSNTQITVIPNEAFLGATALQSIILPEGLASIGVSAFEGTTKLGSTDETTVELHGSLVSIADKAFYNSGIKSINIPYSVETIGVSAFEDATKLQTVTFEEGSAIKELGEYGNATNIFKGTTALTTLTISNTLEVIGDNVFENSGISEILLANEDEPANLAKIGKYAFSGCANLEGFDLMQGITHIGEYAFANCSNLENVKPALGLEFFGGMSFSNCAKITEGYIPATVIQLTGNPYTGCPLTKIDIDPNTNIAYKNGILYDTAEYTVLIAMNAVGDITLPNSVYEIAAGAFADSKITSITIPARITNIGTGTFKNCTELETVTFENGVTAIGSEAFRGCTSLKRIDIPESVTTIGDYVCAGCTSLVNASFADKLDANDKYTIGAGMFQGCTQLVDFALPNQFNGKVIPAYMFEGTAITAAVIPAYITDISTAGVFKNCTSLETVEFKAATMTYTKIGGYLFYGCTQLESVVIPYSSSATAPFSTTSTEGYVFANCTSLKSVSIAIKEYKRSSVSKLMSIVLSVNWTVGENSPSLFENCVNLERVDVTFGTGASAKQGYMIPGKDCFKGCVKLEYVPIIDYSYVYANAFDGATNVGDFTIDKPVTLGSNAFKGCTGNAYFTNVAKTYTITYSGTTKTKTLTASFGAGLFEGWGADQAIYFLNNTEAEITEWFGTAWLQGCEAQVYYADTLANVTELEINDVETAFWTNANLQLFTGATTLKMGTVHGELAANLFEGTAFTTVSFTEYTHAELSEMLEGGALAGCSATVLDKDGNKLVYDAVANTLTVYDESDAVVETYDYNA